MSEGESAFDAPATTKKTQVTFADGSQITVVGQFTTVVRYARQATGEFLDSEGKVKPGENQPFAVFDTDNGRVAVGDGALRNAVFQEIKG
jgi:hypothetical protein